jgi:hypothetical protein
MLSYEVGRCSALPSEAAAALGQVDARFPDRASSRTRRRLTVTRR